MKTIRLMTACMAALLLSSCLHVDEPAGIEAIRNAKAELISAEAQYKLAEIAVLNAQAALNQALADAQVLANKLQELELAKKTAESEQHIQNIEQQIELAILEHQKSLMEKQTALAEAQQAYNDALTMLEFASKEISAEEAAKIQEYTTTLETLSNNISAIDLATLTDKYLKAKYDFQFDYEVTKVNYENDIAIQKMEVADRETFVKLVAGLDATASIADYIAKIDELQAKIDAAQAEITALTEEKSLKKVNDENPLDEQLEALIAETTENTAKINNLQLQQKHYFTDNEKYDKQIIDVPPTLVKDIHDWFVSKNYEDHAQGFVYDYENSTWTVTNNQVVVQFDMPNYSYSNNLDHFKGLTYNLRNFLVALNNVYSPFKNSSIASEADKKAYAVKTQKYLDDFDALILEAKKASDKDDAEIEALNKKQLEINLKTSELNLAKNRITVEIAAIQKTIDNKKAAQQSLVDLQTVYKGLVNGTKIKIPGGTIPTTQDGASAYILTLSDYSLTGKDPVDVQKQLDKWALYAAYHLADAQAELAKKEQRLADYLEAENPERFAEMVAVEVAANELEFQTLLYEMYVAQYEHYSQLLKDFLAAVTGTGREQA